MFQNTDLMTDCLSGNKNEFDKSCDVLIGTTQKIGVDFNRINVLVLAADIQNYFLQILGRVSCGFC